MNIYIYEDSGGGLHITDGEDYASGMEYQPAPGGLVGDIVSFGEWINNATTHGNITEIIDTIDDSSTQCVAHWDGTRLTIEAAIMGAAGLRYAGINADDIR